MFDLSQTSFACALIVWLALSDFKVNQAKIKGGCQSGRKVIPHDYKSDLSLQCSNNLFMARIVVELKYSVPAV